MSLFVNEEFKNYKYLVNVSDNYVILTDSRSVSGSWDNPVEYDVIYQYLTPSILTIETTRTTSSQLNFTQIETSHDFWDRADAPMITISSFIVVFFLLFVINGLTKLVRKGGVFFGF